MYAAVCAASRVPPRYVMNWGSVSISRTASKCSGRSRSARRRAVTKESMGVGRCSGCELIQHVPPHSPSPRLPPPHDDVTTGGVDRRATLRNHRLHVRADVDRVIAVQEQLLAMNGQRGDVVLGHLLDEYFSRARLPMHVGFAGEHQLHVIGNYAEGHRCIAVEPTLTVLRGGGDDGRAVGGRSPDVAVAAGEDEGGDECRSRECSIHNALRALYGFAAGSGVGSFLSALYASAVAPTPRMTARNNAATPRCEAVMCGAIASNAVARCAIVQPRNAAGGIRIRTRSRRSHCRPLVT